MKYHVTFDLSFTRNKGRGKYYSFEGIDGSGKSTQATLLEEYFLKKNKKVLRTKEPTDGEIGVLIRKVLNKEIVLPPISLQYLFCADRAVHLERVVIPALKEGKIVISDRSLWSAITYGLVDQGVPQKQKDHLLVSQNVMSMYGGFLIPDTTFLLDIPFSVALERVDDRGGKASIYDKSKKLIKIRKEYLWLSKKFPEAFTVVEGDHHHTPEQVHKKVLSRLVSSI